MLFSKIYKISRDLRGKIPNFFYSAEAVGAVSVTHKSGPVRRGRRGVILSAVRCAYVFMFCSYFFLCVLAPRSLCSCSVLFFLLLIFLFGFFLFFCLLQRFFHVGFWTVALPCFPRIRCCCGCSTSECVYGAHIRKYAIRP